MLSTHVDSISCSLERHVRGLGLDKVSLYTNDFLVALRESLAEATEWRKGLLGSWFGGLQSIMVGRCGQHATRMDTGHQAG